MTKTTALRTGLWMVGLSTLGLLGCATKVITGEEGGGGSERTTSSAVAGTGGHGGWSEIAVTASGVGGEGSVVATAESVASSVVTSASASSSGAGGSDVAASTSSSTSIASSSSSGAGGSDVAASSVSSSSSTGVGGSTGMGVGVAMTARDIFPNGSAYPPGEVFFSLGDMQLTCSNPKPDPTCSLHRRNWSLLIGVDPSRLTPGSVIDLSTDGDVSFSESDPGPPNNCPGEGFDGGGMGTLTISAIDSGAVYLDIAGAGTYFDNHIDVDGSYVATRCDF